MAETESAGMEVGAGQDRLSVEGVVSGLGTAFMGRNILYLDVVRSTHDEARRLAHRGAPEGMLILADYQTAGRGRLGRRWEAPPGSSLLLSIVLRPVLEPWQAPQVTMVCGLAVADAVAECTGLAVGLKWPNDITVGCAKAGGILTEMEVRGDRIDHVIVGIGLNVNLDPARLRCALAWPATSLSEAVGRPLSRLPLLRALLRALEARYCALQAGRSPADEWAGRLSMLGQSVTVSAPGLSVLGVAEGVAADGALLLRCGDGTLARIIAGDVLPGPCADWRGTPSSAIMCSSASAPAGKEPSGEDRHGRFG